MMIEVRKGFKRTEIIDIPIEWEVHRGFIKIRSGFGFKLNEYTQDGIPLIRINNIKHGELDLDDVVFLPQRYLESYNQFVLEENDLLLALNRPITQGKLKIARIKKENTPAILYQRIGKLEMDENLYDSGYIYHYLQSKQFMKLLEATFVGSDQPFIKNGEFAKLPIIIPPVIEQQKIAAILSSVDETIEKTEAIVKQIEKVKKGLMQQLLTKGIGHTKLKKTEVGEIPEEWEVRKITDIGTFSNGISKNAESFGKGYLFVNVQEIASNEIELDKLNRVNLSEKELAANEVIEGDILLIRSYGNPKKVGYPMLFNLKNTQERFTHSGFTMKLRTHQHIVDSNFLVYVLKSDKIRGEVYKRGTFSANNNINQKEYGSIKVGLPSIEEQRKIAEILGEFDKKIYKEKERITQLQVIKTGLMQSLLTGKVRVKINEAEVIQV